jgi:hypothetical protein
VCERESDRERKIRKKNEKEREITREGESQRETFFFIKILDWEATVLLNDEALK